MAKEKPGVMIYFETARAIKNLDYEMNGRLFEAIMEYAEFGIVPELDGILAAVWPFIADKVDRDSDRYEAIREKRKEAGRKGGEARANNMKQPKANEASATFDKQLKPTSSATETTAPSASTTASATESSPAILRDKGEGKKDNGLTSQTDNESSYDSGVDYVDFEQRRKDFIEKLRKPV